MRAARSFFSVLAPAAPAARHSAVPRERLRLERMPALATLLQEVLTVGRGRERGMPGKRWRSGVTRWALLVTLASALGCETPVDLATKTSCGSFWSTPPEGQPTVLPPGVTVNAGIGSDELFACFYGDEARHEERAAIRWSVDDPSIASLSPMVGPRTEVTGLRFGRTTARALITGVSVPANIYVCETERGCPPVPPL